MYQLSPKSTMLQISADNSTFTPQSVLAGFLSAKGVPSCNLITVTKLAIANDISYEFSEVSGGSVSVKNGENTITGRTQGDLSIVTSINDQAITMPLEGEIVLIKTDQGLTPDLISALAGSIESVYVGAGFVAVKVKESNITLDKVLELDQVVNVSQVVFA